MHFSQIPCDNMSRVQSREVQMTNRCGIKVLISRDSGLGPTHNPQNAAVTFGVARRSPLYNTFCCPTFGLFVVDPETKKQTRTEQAGRELATISWPLSDLFQGIIGRRWESHEG
jgi:hypothetical protein